MLLKFALNEFQNDREYRNLSPRTISSYMASLEEFHEFCVSHEVINLEDCTASLVKNYLVHCGKNRKNNPTTVNSKLHILKIFFNYFEYEMELFTAKTNPTKKIPYAKEEIKIEVFSDEQIKQILNYYKRLKHRDKTLYAYRDYFLVVFMLGSACRLGETVNLRWMDVDLNNQVITVTGKKRVASSIPMTDSLKKEFLEYKLFCEQHFKQLPEYVFTCRKGNQLTDNAVKCIFKHLKANMNFKNVRVSAHTLRHTAAHRMLMSGASVAFIQKFLRHANVNMTLRYFALWGSAMKEQNDLHNPLNTMKF
ncbi:tyrosine-type recombinase/integrase [Paenibacillus vini]|uniref:Tyrosine recombinase XerC n=1 Tax=Paenibacillus vini TaxID=1476024 RepID=A0ABQ4M746_9BACL|nr:site-specific integrase [Paenibacillus vini]GIP51814.1 tyrosine recombinase XerC [Paenibacillus vini]